MLNKSFSSLDRRERFVAYVTIVLIIAAIFVFSVLTAIIIYQRVQTSKMSQPQPSQTVAPLNNENAVNPVSIYSPETNTISTNAAAPLSAPANAN